jgi:hypothetical protein
MLAMDGLPTEIISRNTNGTSFRRNAIQQKSLRISSDGQSENYVRMNHTPLGYGSRGFQFSEIMIICIIVLPNPSEFAINLVRAKTSG